MNFFDQIFSSMRGVQGEYANPMRCQCQFEKNINKIKLSNHTLQMILYFLLMLHINAIESPERPPGKFFIFNLPILSNID